jgi:isocitrate lyase
VATAISAGQSSTTAMAGSTETEQFHDHDAGPDKSHHDDGLVHGHAWAVSSPER